MPPDESPPSRAELQSQLRKSRKKAKRRQHRWRRRIIITLSAIIVLALVSVAGAYFYVDYRFDQIKKVHLKHLVAAPAPGKPFTMLFIGSDSRAFVGNNTGLANEVGNSGDAGGQRSDVTIVARFVPATKSITVMSIPRDLWVNIPGNVSGISGMNRINAAYNNGPDLLIQTIEQDLNIPINHYVSVDFPGFTGMVNALGGIDMDFPTGIRDAYTGLDVTTLGCQNVNGVTALQLVRSRHLEYVNTQGYWEDDGMSDFSRIQRQDSFFRAVLAKVNQSSSNPLALNGFISAAVGNLTIDDTLSKSDIFHIATEFKGLASSHLVTETLPTTEYVTSGGADVLLPAQPYDDQMIAAFNQLGLPKPPPTTTTTTTPLAPGAVTVDVLNASGGGELASQTASGLENNGFTVSGVANAPSVIPSGSPSQIFYGPDGLAAAHTLGDSLSGAVSYVANASLTGNDVTLWVANAQLTVNAAPNTTTTIAGNSGNTGNTGTTNPADVVTNTQPEPWNPVPCTLGSTTTTVVVPKKAPVKPAEKTTPTVKGTPTTTTTAPKVTPKSTTTTTTTAAKSG